MKYSVFHPGNILAFFRLFLMISVITVGIAIGFILKLVVKDTNRWRYSLRTFVSTLVLKILGIKIICTGELNLDQGLLYVSNHRTLIDGVIVLSLIPSGHVISKAEVKSYPIISTGANLAGVIYVDRTDRENRSAVKNTIINSLRSKRSIILFPEGTISIDKKVLDYKKGAFEAAIEAGAEVQTIVMEFMNPKRDFWLNRNMLLQFFVTFSQWKIVCKVHFFDKIKGIEAMDLCTRIQRMTQAKLDEFQLEWKNQDSMFSS